MFGKLLGYFEQYQFLGINWSDCFWSIFRKKLGNFVLQHLVALEKCLTIFTQYTTQKTVNTDTKTIHFDGLVTEQIETSELRR